MASGKKGSQLWPSKHVKQQDINSVTRGATNTTAGLIAEDYESSVEFFFEVSQLMLCVKN